MSWWLRLIMDSTLEGDWLMATVERTQTAGIRLTEGEQRIWADIDWAEQEPEIRTKYPGEWVAILNRTVVAHGLERGQVIRAAVAATHQSEEAIAVWPVAAPEAFLADRPADELVW